MEFQRIPSSKIDQKNRLTWIDLKKKTLIQFYPLFHLLNVLFRNSPKELFEQLKQNWFICQLIPRTLYATKHRRHDKDSKWWESRWHRIFVCMCLCTSVFVVARCSQCVCLMYMCIFPRSHTIDVHECESMLNMSVCMNVQSIWKNTYQKCQRITSL